MPMRNSKPPRVRQRNRQHSSKDETSTGGTSERDITGVIRSMFPDGIVELPYADDAPDVDAAYPNLRSQLAAIDGAVPLYEREPRGGPVWDDEADPEEDPPTGSEHARSYHFVFLALEDERFRYTSQDQVEDEEGLRKVEGTGRIGCTVAISLLAPVAIVRFDDMEQFEDGSETVPEIGDRIFDLDGRPIDPERHFRNMMGNETVQALTLLAEKIATTLAARGIMVLPREQLERQVRWLRAGEETLIGGDPGCPVTVLDAFFFEQL